MTEIETELDRDLLADLAARLRTVPGFNCTDPATVRARRLGGVTNDTYLVGTAAGDCVLKVHREGGRTLAREVAATRLAAALGIAPEVLWFDAAAGHCAFRFVPDSRVLHGADLSDTSVRRLLESVVRKLHESDIRFAERLDPPAVLDDYLCSLRGDAVGRKLAQELEPLCESVSSAARRSSLLVPLHGDLVPENLLIAGDRVWLIDWEYAAMGDPLWDIAYMAVESGSPDAAGEALLRSAVTDENEQARYPQVVQLVLLINLVWCALQIAQRNHRTDFASVYIRRFGELRARLADDGT